MEEWKDNDRYPHDGNLCDEKKKKKYIYVYTYIHIYIFFLFPLGHSLADKFSLQSLLVPVSVGLLDLIYIRHFSLSSPFSF